MCLRKLPNYCMRSATDFIYSWLICKFVFVMFSGTRKKTLNKQCQNCVFLQRVLFWVEFTFNKPEDAFDVFRCKNICYFLINNMFLVQHVATGRSVYLIHFNFMLLVTFNGVYTTSGCCSCHRNFVWYSLKWRSLIENIVSVCVWETPRLNPLRFTLLHLSDICTWCGRRSCRCSRMSEHTPPKSEQLWGSDPTSCVWNSYD
jgi:hypothetical protein